MAVVRFRTFGRDCEVFTSEYDDRTWVTVKNLETGKDRRYTAEYAFGMANSILSVLEEEGWASRG